MRKMKVPAYFGLLSFAVLLVAVLLLPVTCTQVLHAQTQASAPASGEMYVYCLSDRSAPVVYFSEVFTGKPDPPSSRMRQVSFTNIAKDFLVFLQQKYSYKSDSSYPTTCVGRTSGSAEAPGSKQKLEDQYKQANKQIVETGWKNH
jgi:hypothetical protein